MTELKDKVATLELLKYYHDRNEATYTKFVHLTYDGSAVKGSDGKAMSFSQLSSTVSLATNQVDVKYGTKLMVCVNRTSSAVEFADVHITGGKYYIGWLSMGSDNRVTYKESNVAFSADIIKNLSGMTGDATHRTVTDAQIDTWNGKMNETPIATVAETKEFLGIS